MADIEMRLVAGVDQYISDIKQGQNAFQSFNNTVVSGSQEQEEFINGVVEGIQQEIAAIKNSDKEIKKLGGSFKTELKGIKDELQKMEAAGLSGSKRFMELSLRAGELEDQIGDTRQQIKILASDTKNLDAAMSVGQGLAGGFALAQGAIALFGEEGENLQKQLVKLQGGLNLLNGMQQVANTLNKDSAARVVIMAKAQQAYNLIVGQSTGAMKAFKLALAATGIGLFIIALGLLIANWDKVKKSVTNMFSPNRELSAQIEQQTILIDKLTEAGKRRATEIDREIALLEAQGDKEEEIFNLKKERAKADLQIQLASIGLTKKQLALSQEELNRRVKINTLASSNPAIRALVDLFYGTEKAANATGELNTKLDEQNEAYKDIQNQIAVLDALELKRVNGIKEKAAEKSLTKQDELAKKLAESLKTLADRYQEAKLSSLSGKDRINEEERIQLEEIEALKNQLEKLKDLSKDQYNQIETIKTAIKQDAAKKRSDIDKAEIERFNDQSAKYKDITRKIAEDELELIGASEAEKLKLKQKFYLEDIALLEKANDSNNWQTIVSMKQQVELIQKELDSMSGKSSFSIWKLLGFDPESEEGKKGIEALKQTGAIILDQVSQIMQADIAAAEKHTQLIESRLSDAENQLEKEKDLQEQGLANNVDAKQKEIAQLKIEREKALEEEKKAQKAQLLLDSATQLSSLITATANIWKANSSIPYIGTALAIAGTALMWGSFAAAKIKASQAIDAKAEYGAYGDDSGMVVGKRHSQGGERFIDHLEVEHGERWGILNRTASNKYATLFPEMISSMNNLSFPGMRIKGNHTTVNVDTKKMQSELESINTGIRILNDNMANSGDVFYSGKAKVMKLSKNHTRIIHATN